MIEKTSKRSLTQSILLQIENFFVLQSSTFGNKDKNTSDVGF